MINVYDLLLCFCLVFLSSFLAASEVSLFSLSRFQLRGLKESFKTVYVQIKELLSDPSGLLVSILVTAEIINVSIASIIEKIILRNWSSGPSPFMNWVPFSWLNHVPDWLLQTLVGILFTTPLLLVVCEVTPKFLAARANHLIAPLTAPTLLTLYWILSPVRWALRLLLKLFGLEKPLSKVKSGKNNERAGSLIREDEFLFMIEEGHKEGIVHSSELELIRNIFELDDTRVEEVCTPLGKVVSLQSSLTMQQALDLFKSKKFSRMPVHSGDRTDIVGILYAKDLIPVRLNPSIQKHSIEGAMRKPLFIKRGSRLTHAFRIMRQNQVHMAIIQDEHSQSVGIITMSDVLDEVFGEFFESGTTMSKGPSEP